MADGEDLTLAMRLYLEANGFRSGLRNSENDLRRWGSGARREMASVGQQWDAMIGHFGRGLAALAGDHYLLGGLKKGVNDAAALQDALLAVRQILQGAHPQAKLLADEMQRIKDNAIDVSRHTKFGATAVTEVTRQLLQGGVPLQAILGSHGAAIAVETLAETQGTNPAQTAMDLANVGHSYQLDPKQYGNTADLIARASVTASGGLTGLMYNLGRVGAIAHTAHIPIKDLLAALKTLSPLGEQGGSDLAAVIQTMENARMRGTRYMRAFHLDFFDKNGKFIGLTSAIEMLKTSLAKMPTDKKRLEALGLIFQAGGSAAASLLVAPSRPGAKSYDEILGAIDQQASLVQQREVRMSGLTMQGEVLGHNLQTSLAQIFKPALEPLTKLDQTLSRLATRIGELAKTHTTLDKAALGVGATVAAGVGVYGIAQILKGLAAGGGILKTLARGAAGTAVGIGEGKLVQQMAGVTPVFVVNMPGGGIGGDVGAGLAGGLLGSKAGKVLRGGSALWRLLSSSIGGDLAAGALGATGFAMLGGAALAGGGIGYGMGTVAYKHMGRDTQQVIGGTIATILSWLGNKNARDAIQQTLYGGTNFKGVQGSGELHISIDGHGNPIVKQLSTRGTMPHITVETGPLRAAAMP